MHSDPSENQDPDQLVRKIADWVNSPELVDSETKEVLDNIASSSQAKLSLFQNVFAMSKTKKLASFQKMMESVVEKLYDPSIVSMIDDPRVLIQMVDTMNRVIKEDTAFVERTRKDVPMGKGVEHFLHIQGNEIKEQESGDMVESLKEISPQNRETLRKAVNALLTNIANASQEDSEKDTLNGPEQQG